METVDKELVNALSAAKKGPCNFAVAVGAECALVVSKKAIAPAKIKAAKDQAGGGRVLQGRCFAEDGIMVFELDVAPPGGLDKKIREAVKHHANMSLNVEVRQVAELKPVTEGEEAETESEDGVAHKTEPTLDLAVPFKDRLKALTPDYQAAGKAAPAVKPALDKIVAQAMAAAKAQDYQQGLAHLDRLETAIKGVKQAGTAPDGNAAAFKDRLKVLMPAYMEAGKTAPDQKPTLDKILAEATAAAKAQNYVAALAELDQLDAAIKTAKKSGTPPAGNAAAFKDRLKALMPPYQQALKLDAAAKPVLEKSFAQVMDLAKAQNFDQALKKLDGLEGVIKAVLARTAKQQKAGTGENESPEKESTEGGTAKKQGTASGENEASEEETSEEDGDKVDLAAEFKTLLKSLQPKLAKLLETLKQSSPGDAKDLQAQLTKALGAFQGGNHAGAYDLLTTLDGRVATLIRTAEAGKDVDLASPVRKASFHKARDQWNQARNLAKAQLQKFAQAILADPDAQSEPDWDVIRAGAEGLPAEMDAFDASLGEAIARAASDEASEREAGMRDAQKLIADYRKELAGNELYQLTDGDSYGNFKVAAVLTVALDAVAKKLES